MNDNVSGQKMQAALAGACGGYTGVDGIIALRDSTNELSRSRTDESEMRKMGGVLVAYATRYGSTKEVAESVGETLRAQGIEVGVTPARLVSSLGRYDGVVLAAPFYIGSLLKDAREFSERHREALEQLPVALLGLGPLSADDDMQEARGQLDSALSKMPWLEPVAAEMFVGKYDPAHLRLIDKLAAALPASPLHGETAHDDRDWDAIRGWAGQLPEVLHLSR